MHKSIVVDRPESELRGLADSVCRSNEPVNLETPNGDAVKVIPVPKPIRYRKGVPVYKAEDLQYLFLDYPHLFER